MDDFRWTGRARVSPVGPHQPEAGEVAQACARFLRWLGERAHRRARQQRPGHTAFVVTGRSFDIQSAPRPVRVCRTDWPCRRLVTRPASRRTRGVGGRRGQADPQHAGEFARRVLVGQSAEHPCPSGAEYRGQRVVVVLGGCRSHPREAAQRVHERGLRPARREARAGPQRRHELEATTRQLDIRVQRPVDLDHAVAPPNARVQAVHCRCDPLRRELPGAEPQVGLDDMFDRRPQQLEHLVVVVTQ